VGGVKIQHKRCMRLKLNSYLKDRNIQVKILNDSIQADAVFLYSAEQPTIGVKPQQPGETKEQYFSRAYFCIAYELAKFIRYKNISDVLYLHLPLDDDVKTAAESLLGVQYEFCW